MSTFPQRRRPTQRAFSRLVGLQGDPKVVSLSTIKGSVIDEDALRKQFGVETKEKPRTLPSSYRSLLNLDPDDVVNFFNSQVDEHTELAEIDFIVPRSMLEHRIARLNRVIACSKEIIEGMSARVIMT